jgi:general secretion pathway protein C
MKRLPLVVSLLAVIALSASIAYWVLELYKPPQRPMAAISEAQMPDPSPDSGATLFGGQAQTAGPSNYQLTGVVAAGRESMAILVVDGQPARALAVGREVVSGVTVKEVQPKFVVLSDGGVLKRIELATDGKAGGNVAMAAPTAVPQQQSPDAPQPTPQPQPPNQPMEPPQPVPSLLPPGVPPPPAPVQMPAPTRNMSGQGNAPPTQ